jgi:hypothetical protein
VIGIVTAKAAAEESIGFCIPVEDLRSALDKGRALRRDEIARAEKLHDVESILRRLHHAGRANLDAVEAYLSSMARAQDQGDSPAAAILAAMRVIEPRLVALNQSLTDGIPAEVHDHIADLELPLPIRRDLSALWDTFATLRDLAEQPRGDLHQVLARCQSTPRNFRERVDRLKRALGAELED